MNLSLCFVTPGPIPTFALSGVILPAGEFAFVPAHDSPSVILKKG